MKSRWLPLPRRWRRRREPPVVSASMEIQIVDHAEFARQRQTAIHDGQRDQGFYERTVDRIRLHGPMFVFFDWGFIWECPGCGSVYLGDVGDHPVAGWESPVWQRTGPDNAPSLTPSLGCQRSRVADCKDGHWWLRHGHLVRA